MLQNRLHRGGVEDLTQNTIKLEFRFYTRGFSPLQLTRFFFLIKYHDILQVFPCWWKNATLLWKVVFKIQYSWFRFIACLRHSVRKAAPIFRSMHTPIHALLQNSRAGLTLLRYATKGSFLVFKLVGQPIQTLIKPISAGGTRCLDVPVSLTKGMQAKFVCDLCSIHSIGKILWGKSNQTVL